MIGDGVVVPVWYHKKERDAMQQRIDDLLSQNKKLITANARLCDLEQENERLKGFEKAGRYYLRMQKHIQTIEAVEDAWKHFVTLYVLAVPDIRELGDLPD